MSILESKKWAGLDVAKLPNLFSALASQLTLWLQAADRDLI